MRFTPDVAYLVQGVETSDATLAVAQRENAERMTALRARLAALGLAGGDVHTTGYTVELVPGAVTGDCPGKHLRQARL